MDGWDGEQLVLCHHRELGMRAVIAIDDTTRGPGLGGVRYAAYPTQEAAAVEATRLAEAMTRKHAAAGLPYGGAKAVILADGEPADRRALMRAFAHFVARLGGAYIPGVDVGTTIEDLAEIATIAPDVACHEADPSPWTALGVHAAIRAAVAVERGADDAGSGRAAIQAAVTAERGDEGLEGVRVAVQGAGHVGADLVRLLCADGALVTVSDTNAARVTRLAHDTGARVVHPDALLDEPCDVLAPCAMARVLNAGTIPRLRCRIVAGAANDTVATPADVAQIAARGIAYVPDFVANAGGVIHIHALREHWSEQELRDAVLEIGPRVHAVLRTATATGELPLDVAERMAMAALGRELEVAA